MLFTVLLCMAYFQWSFMIQITEQCLETANGDGPPSFADYRSGNGQITEHHQAIITSYKFSCCGNITEWRVDVHEGGSTDQRQYTLNFQVWRPTPTVTTQEAGSYISGHYNLVGNNRFTSISLSAGAVQVTPSPRDYIAFRPGDVLGFYVEKARSSDSGVVAITSGSAPSEYVWYASVTPQNRPHCDEFGFGFNGFGRALTTLIRAAPVIEIDTKTYGCWSTVHPCSGIENTLNLWSVGGSTETADTVNTARTSDSSSGRPHPTPPPSITIATTEPIDDMDATTMPETNVPLIPTEPHIGTTEGTKIITEQTTEDFMNTEVESMTFEPIVDDSNGIVSGRAGSQSGVIAGTVLAVFLAIFLVLFTAIFVVLVMSKKRISLAHTNQQLQDISNDNGAALNNPVYDCANEESSNTHTDQHFQGISNAGHSSTWNNPTYDCTLSNDIHSFGIDTENNPEVIYCESS